jgi:hypothetical protein
MSISSTAPYTSANAINSVMRRFREKGLTTPITGDVLVRAGVSDSLVPRTLQALQLLDLIDDAGQPTPTFQKMRSVPEAGYKACLAEWLQSVYAEVFKFVDPGTDDATQVRDAFRTYTPHGQQDRMVALFLALCAEAGLAPETKKSEPKPAARKPTTARVQPAASRSKPLQTPASHGGVQIPAFAPALAGLLQSIPTGATGWTKQQRDKFIVTFESVLDFVVPIVEETADVQGDNDV